VNFKRAYARGRSNYRGGGREKGEEGTARRIGNALVESASK